MSSQNTYQKFLILTILICISHVHPLYPSVIIIAILYTDLIFHNILWPMLYFVLSFIKRQDEGVCMYASTVRKNTYNLPLFPKLHSVIICCSVILGVARVCTVLYCCMGSTGAQLLLNQYTHIYIHTHQHTYVHTHSHHLLNFTHSLPFLYHSPLMLEQNVQCSETYFFNKIY